MLRLAFTADGGTAETATVFVEAPSDAEPMGVVQFGHERIRSISSAAAAVEVAEGFQCWLADASGVVWPVCPVHRTGGHPRLVSGAAAWVCAAGGHVIPGAGFGGGGAVGEDRGMTSSAVPAVFAGPIRVVGLGLLLREWEAGDVPAMVELFDDDEVARWTPLASPFDRAAAERYFQRAQERRAQGFSVQLAVTTDGRTPLGELSAFRRGDDGREVELGYAIGASYRGRGLATRSVRLLTGFAYRELEARRVILRIEPGNEASRAVARATGYRLADQPQVPVTEPDGSEVLLDVWEHVRD
jgi:RimJ/RimL family protein N-acetyltransferase